MSSPIVRFYSGEIGDHRGRSLASILAWDHSRLEGVHDYIQWLFPLPEPSPVNPAAPVIDAPTVKQFAGSEELRVALRRSLQMMVEFYGFRFTNEGNPRVERGPGFERAAANWLSPGDHNFLRITRILRSTRLLGLPEESQAFFRALEELYKTERGQKAIGRVSFGYWKQAAES